MFTKYCMSDTLGTMVYVDNDQDSFFGRMSATSVSEATQQKVDAEIRRILDVQYSVARTLIADTRDKVEAMTKALLASDTIYEDTLKDTMSALPPLPPNPRHTQHPGHHPTTHS